MSLYISYINPQKGELSLEWHIGEPIPDQLVKDAPRVVHFQADGDELDMINHAMKGNHVLLEPLEVLVTAAYEDGPGTNPQLPPGAISGHELQMNLGGLLWFHYHKEPAKDVDQAMRRGLRTVGFLRQALYDHYKVVAVDSRVNKKLEQVYKLRRQLAALEAEIQEAVGSGTEPRL